MESELSYQGVAMAAAELLERALGKIAAEHKSILDATDDLGAPRLFFPNGIETIFLSFKVGKDIDLTFTIAGKEAKYPAYTASSLNIDRKSQDQAGNSSIATPDGGAISVGSDLLLASHPATSANQACESDSAKPAK